MIKEVYWSSCKVPVIFVTFWWNFCQGFFFFEKYSNIKFHENPSSGSRAVPCGRTDMTKLIVAFLQFCERAKKLRNWSKLEFLWNQISRLLFPLPPKREIFQCLGPLGHQQLRPWAPHMCVCGAVICTTIRRRVHLVWPRTVAIYDNGTLQCSGSQPFWLAEPFLESISMAEPLRPTLCLTS